MATRGQRKESPGNLGPAVLPTDARNRTAAARGHCFGSSDRRSLPRGRQGKALLITDTRFAMRHQSLMARVCVPTIFWPPPTPWPSGFQSLQHRMWGGAPLHAFGFCMRIRGSVCASCGCAFRIFVSKCASRRERRRYAYIRQRLQDSCAKRTSRASTSSAFRFAQLHRKHARCNRCCARNRCVCERPLLHRRHLDKAGRSIRSSITSAWPAIEKLGAHFLPSKTWPPVSPTLLQLVRALREEIEVPIHATRTTLAPQRSLV